MTSCRSPSSLDVTMNDLDGYSAVSDMYETLHSQTYYPNHSTASDFGFDPPLEHATVKMEHSVTPLTEDDLFQNSPLYQPQRTNSIGVRALELDSNLGQPLPSGMSAVSRYGQVTPPRSNSEESLKDNQMYLRTADKRRRTSKAAAALPPESLVDSATQSNKKSRKTRKLSTLSSVDPEEDAKRKMSLEKNRVAAAKCRVHKKEKTDQLQRESHEKAMENAFLKDQIILMQEEIQQINSLLLSHANYDGCKSPDDIQKYLNMLGKDFVQQPNMSSAQDIYPAYPVDLAQYSTHYHNGADFDPSTGAHHNEMYMHPALPEFENSGPP